MHVQYSRNTLNNKVFASNLIDAIKLPFRKEKELYRSFHSILGFYPRDIRFYKEALMHRSMSARSKEGKPLNNERLEFLGDAVLDAIVGEIVFQHFQGKKEGFLTNARSKIVQRESLGQLAVKLGLDKLVHSNSHNHSHNSYMAGNAFEAMVGAVYLDRGYKYCQRFVNEQIIGKLIDLDKIAYKEMNFKSKLLEWSQKYKVQLEFELLEEGRNEQGSPTFRTKVTANGIELGRGKGFSKKESHQQACKNALYRLKDDKRLYIDLTKKNKKEEQ